MLAWSTISLHTKSSQAVYPRTHVCLHIHRHTLMHVCKHMHIYIHLPGTATSSLQPLKRGGKEAEGHISFLSKQAMSFLLRVGRGWSAAMTGLGKEPLWSIFHRHPRQNCCQKHCLISFLTAGLDPPTKRGIVSSPAPLASALQRSAGRLREGIWGMKALHPVPQPLEGSQILELKELSPG